MPKSPRELLFEGWRPMESRSCTRKRDLDGRIVTLEVWWKTKTGVR